MTGGGGRGRGGGRGGRGGPLAGGPSGDPERLGSRPLQEVSRYEQGSVSTESVPLEMFKMSAPTSQGKYILSFHGLFQF